MLTKVGDHCLLMVGSHVAHDCIVGNHVIMANNATLAGHVEIGEYAIIGGLSAVHQFAKIGSHVMISGGSLVRKDVPPFVKAAHEPLSYVGINAVGLRRRGFSPEKIAEIQDIYRLFFVKGYSNTHALEVIEKEIQPSEEKNQILSFIRKSTRGLMKGYTQYEE